MNKDQKIKRTLEMIPGLTSWGIMFLLALLAFFNPIACAVLLIIFNFYWIIRTIYLNTLLIMAHRKLFRQKDYDWLAKCRQLKPGGEWEDIYHLIIFPVYKEGLEILRPSLEALRQSHFPKERMIVVMGFEERNPESRKTASVLEEEFKTEFLGYLSTFHPDGLAGEARTKGANATWAAQKAGELLNSLCVASEDTVISCFDADTCVDKEYFGCLTFHFLTTPDPHQASYQPMPVYNNNIWYAPSFARLVEISASYSQMIDSMRLEKFVTFSSHSMSFKTLVDINYWPVDMISDDSVIYWKAFLHYNGRYRVIPLYITVSMDAAYSTSFFKTIAMQYKQKRRWAWGIENFPLVVAGFLKKPGIPFLTKFRRSANLLESHVMWAIWANVIILIAPLPLLLGGKVFAQIPIGYNLPLITGMLFNFTFMVSLLWIVLSRTILPPRPRDVSWFKNITLLLEWVLVPFIILLLGSNPALDAQTRLMLGKYMQFNPTEKKSRR